MMTDPTDTEKYSLGRECRLLLRAAGQASLATLDETGAPYASLVMTACRPDGTPILLLSDLAEHTQNIKRDPQVSILIDGTAGLDDPLSGARVTLQGAAAESEDTADRQRFLNRHPSAAIYADFADFAVYTVDIARAHLVAGFGRIDWIEAAALAFDTAGCEGLIAGEADILAHMNQDHTDAVRLYAEMAGRKSGDWKMTGIDPEGIDLRLAGETARLDFESVISDAEGARTVLAGLAKQARRAGT